VGLPCFIVCGHCHGQSCFNVTRDDNSADTFCNMNIEETEYDEMNVIDYLTPNILEESESAQGEIEGDVEDEKDIEDEDVEEISEIKDNDEEKL